MSNGTAYSPSTHGAIWQRGFMTMFWRELQTWRWRKFSISAIAWFVVLIVLALVLGANAGISASSSSSNAQTLKDSAKGFFFQAWLFFPMLAAVFSTLGAISDERKEGTLPWVLSKPLPRSAFYLAKLLANLLVKSVTIILIPGLIAAVILLARGVTVNPAGTLGAMKLVGIMLFFYVAYTLMMDVLNVNRTITLLIPILLLFASPLLPQLAMIVHMVDLGNFLAQVTPMGITDGLLVNWMTKGQAPNNLVPMIFTLLWAIAFTIVGIVAFKRQEI
jgi:ABC-type transport system involved in multi-copper enzyme maturation permease subunit